MKTLEQLREENRALSNQAHHIDLTLAETLERFRLTNENEILRAKMRERGIEPKA
jgi:hypothetical protein